MNDTIERAEAITKVYSKTHLTPVGQTFYLLTVNSVGNMLTAAVIAIVFIAVLLP